MLRLIFWPVLTPSFLFSAGIGAVVPVAVLAALQVGASEALASGIVAIVGAVALMVTVPVGVFIDRVGDRAAMIIATTYAAVMLCAAAYAIAVPSSWSLALFIAAAVLRTPAMVAWNLSRQAVVADLVPAASRGMAMTALGGTQRAGNVVGPLLGALLLLFFPLWSVYLFCAAMGLLATAVMYFTSTKLEARQRRAKPPGEQVEGVRWRAVGFAGVAVLTLALARVAQPVIVALWGVYLGWSEAQISLLVAAGAAIELVVMFPGGYLKDQVGRTAVLSGCLLLYGTGFLLAPLWPTAAGLILAVFVMSLGNGFGAGINMTIGADLSPSHGRARFLAIWAMFSQGGQLGGPFLISACLLIASLPVAVAFVGGLTIAGGVWSMGTARITQLPKGAGLKLRPRRSKAPGNPPARA